MSLIIAALVLLNLNVIALKVHADIFKNAQPAIEEQAPEQPSLFDFLEKAVDFIRDFQHWVDQKDLDQKPIPQPPDRTPLSDEILETKAPRAPPFVV